MTTSILDEKEMSTSFLSQAAFQDGDSLVGSFPPSMADSMDFNLYNSSLQGSNCLRRDLMESSLVNSGTFNSMLESFEDKLPNGKSKFHLKRSFLKESCDDRNSIDRYLKLNSNCNTDDLRNLAADLLAASEKREDLNETFNVDERGIPKDDDSFLLNDGMSDSFLKYAGRESLNVTYNKLPTQSKLNRVQKEPQIDQTEQTVLLPNQTFSPSHQNLTNKKLINGMGDTITKYSPKRNATFRKSALPNYDIHGDVLNMDIDIDNKLENQENIDSNKESYVTTEKNDSIYNDLPSPHSEQSNLSNYKRKVSTHINFLNVFPIYFLQNNQSLFLIFRPA